MEKLIEQLLGRPFMASGDEGSGGNAGAANNGAGGNVGGNAGEATGGGSAAGGGPAASKAAEIAARAGGAFSTKPASKAVDGAQGADDGIDPASRPKANGADAGARPDHIPEKFWDAKTKAPKVDEIAKAYTTLEAAHTALKNDKGWGKAGEKVEDYVPEWKPPADAKLDRIRDIDVKTDPAVGAYRKIALKHKLPVDVAGSIMLDFLTELNPLIDAPKTEADIVAELGEGGAALRDELGTWLSSHFDSKTFSEAELEWAFQNFGKDATGVRVLAKVRELMGEKPIPLSPGKSSTDIPSIEEWYAMNRDPRMASDPAFREKVEALGERIFGDAPAGTSEAGVGVPPPRKVERRERASTRG